MLQAIPLDVVYEDEYLLVVNKQAGLVVHPSPGHAAGTLVNALLHHCHLPAMRVVARTGGGLESAALAGTPLPVCKPTQPNTRPLWLIYAFLEMFGAPPQVRKQPQP